MKHTLVETACYSGQISSPQARGGPGGAEPLLVRSRSSENLEGGVGGECS